MKDLTFREGLKNLLEQDDDKKIIVFVLDHTTEQWPVAFTFWLLRKQREYDIL